MKGTILRSARRRWCLGFALCAVVALLAAVANEKGVSLLPPSSHSRGLQIAGASAQASVDLPRTSIVQVGANGVALGSLTVRTVLLGEMMSTQPVLAEIAYLAGVNPSQLSASTTFVQNVPEQMIGPDLEVRANQIIASRAPYQLNIQPDPNVPRLEIYAQAPTPAQAERLADAAVGGLRDYLRADAISHGADPSNQVRVEQLGPARGGVINSPAKYEIVGLTFLSVFAVCAALIVLVGRVRRGWQLAARRDRPDDTPSGPGWPAPAFQDSDSGPPELRLSDFVLAANGSSGKTALLPRPTLPRVARPRVRVSDRGRHIAGGGGRHIAGGGGRHIAAYSRRRVAAYSRRRVAAGAVDDWPHTTRVLPWMIAAFLFIIWVVPFDSIQIGASLPIDLKFDRIVLPIVMLAWILAIAAGGRAAPRLRLSWVHAGVFLFAGLTLLSFVIDAHYLNQNLLLDQGVKQLALLLAYVAFFVMIASIVRGSEVSAFLRYSLVLAVVAAVGTIIQYRFHYNVFYDLAQKLFPGFQVAPSPGGVDNLGRSVVSGPAELPLEAVGMFTMALPIALVGITEASRWRGRILYGLAAALLLAASLTTERKSGLLGPLAAVLTLAFFKRRQLIRLAPLGVVVVAVVKIIAPGAIGAVTGQLAPSQLGVTTVDDRVLRYDAIRPDVWLHLVFGQGFGTYSLRVLDNELLDRLIEGGVLGLSAYILMLLLIVVVAVGAARRRELGSAAIALVAAAAAVSVIVMSGLFDLMAYPHDPYILFSLAGLLAVAVKDRSPTDHPRTKPRTKAPPVPNVEPRLEGAWTS